MTRMENIIVLVVLQLVVDILLLVALVETAEVLVQGIFYMVAQELVLTLMEQHTLAVLMDYQGLADGLGEVVLMKVALVAVDHPTANLAIHNINGLAVVVDILVVVAAGMVVKVMDNMVEVEVVIITVLLFLV